jgi:predicted Zn-dependent protease
MTEETSSPARYEGGAFHPTLENGRASGFLQLTAAGVRFESDRGTITLPLDGLKVELGGASDRVLFFKHASEPKGTIHTSDHRILEDPVLRSHPELISQVGVVRKKKRMAWVVLLSVVGVLLGLVVALVLSKDRIVAAVAGAVPTDWEVKLGDKIFEQLMTSRRKVDDPELNRQLAIITEPLLRGIKDSRYPFKFHIVEDPTLNAFAVPGGNVVIHSGLLLASDRPEEVAGVLAHEIAHVTRRHGFRSVVSSLGLYQILGAFIGDASGLLAVLANNGAFLLDRKFSRDFEREADLQGWEYLMRANVEPRGMIEFFRKMQLEEKKMTDPLPVEGAESALEIVSTHPATAERLQSLQAKWEAVETKTGFYKFQLNYPEFKDRLRSRLHSAPATKGSE